MELGILQKSELEPELSISRWFEAGGEQALEHQQFGPGLKPGFHQRHRCYLALIPVQNPSHKMEGTVAAFAGHTSCCGFEKSEKKRSIKTARLESFQKILQYIHLGGRSEKGLLFGKVITIQRLSIWQQGRYRVKNSRLTP